MNNIKVFENDLPDDLDLSNEKFIGLDNEALGLVLGRDPLTLVQLGLESKNFYLIKLNRNSYKAPNLVKVLSNNNTQFNINVFGIRSSFVCSCSLKQLPIS